MTSGSCFACKQGPVVHETAAPGCRVGTNDLPNILCLGAPPQGKAVIHVVDNLAVTLEAALLLSSVSAVPVPVSPQPGSFLEAMQASADLSIVTVGDWQGGWVLGLRTAWLAVEAVHVAPFNQAARLVTMWMDSTGSLMSG